MKISCHIIEDEPLASDLLAYYIAKISSLSLVKVCSNPLQALEVLKSQPVDLIFLDIQMPEMTGISLLKVLKKKPLVILTTAYSEYALESYDFDVVDYLKKPITFERFVKGIQKVEQRLAPAINIDEKLTGKDFIFVKDGTRFVKITLSEILFVQGQQNYVHIHTAKQKITSLQRLKSLNDQLPGDKFIRIHNSYIINVNAISSVKNGEIEIGSQKIPIGETYLKSFMDFIDKLHIH
jgi:two-component system LytT family response regulator